MNTEHYRDAANALDQRAETLDILAAKLDVKAELAAEKARKAEAKAKRLKAAANDMRTDAKGRRARADNYRRVATLTPQLERDCLGCVLGYVPVGTTYNEIHSCGQRVGALNTDVRSES